MADVQAAAARALDGAAGRDVPRRLPRARSAGAGPPEGRARAGQIKSLAGIERALQRAIGVESARLQRFLPFLATTASATPFIGLLEPCGGS